MSAESDVRFGTIERINPTAGPGGSDAGSPGGRPARPPGLSSVKEKPEKLGKEQGEMKERGHI
jgi:hypothetical protein